MSFFEALSRSLATNFFIPSSCIPSSAVSTLNVSTIFGLITATAASFRLPWKCYLNIQRKCTLVRIIFSRHRLSFECATNKGHSFLRSMWSDRAINVRRRALIEFADLVVRWGEDCVETAIAKRFEAGMHYLNIVLTISLNNWIFAGLMARSEQSTTIVRWVIPPVSSVIQTWWARKITSVPFAAWNSFTCATLK